MNGFLKARPGRNCDASQVTGDLWATSDRLAMICCSVM